MDRGRDAKSQVQRWFAPGVAENVSRAFWADNRVAVHLLDTDILIDFLRGREEARAFMGRYEAAAEPPLISVVSVTELWAGMRHGEERATSALLSALRKIPLSEEIAFAAGNMLRTYRRSHGTELGDALIASTAVELSATLITRNVKHYPMPTVKVLRPY